MAQLKRVYKSKNLKGLSNNEYYFCGYSPKLEFPDDAEKVEGIFYIGKLDEDDRVIDHFDLGFTYDILATFNKYREHEKLQDDSDLLHVFFYEGKDKMTLEEIIKDLEKQEYKKDL